MNRLREAIELAAPISIDGLSPDQIPWQGSSGKGWNAAFRGLRLNVSTKANDKGDLSTIVYRLRLENVGNTGVEFKGVKPLDFRFGVEGQYRPVVRHLSGSWHYDAVFPPRAFRIQEQAFMTEDHAKPVIIGGANSGTHSPVMQVALASPARLEGMFCGFQWSAGWEIEAGWTQPSFRGEPRSSFRVSGDIAAKARTLSPGESVTYPPVHLGFFTTDTWVEADDRLRSYIRSIAPTPTQERPRRPVAYNTWFGTAENYDLNYLLAQAGAASEIGCEYFCLDAAWYRGGETFFEGIGNWDTPDPMKFGDNGNGLDVLRDRVRQLGMRFGLWLVPQVAQPGTDIVDAAPHLYRNSDASHTRPDYERRFGTLHEGFPQLERGLRLTLETPEGVEHLLAALRRLIRRWDVDWIRVESVPEDGLAYNSGYDRVLDTVRAEFPNLYLELCNGGGQRLDLAAVTRHDGNWLSDHTSDPHVVRSMQAGALRFWPADYLNMAVVSQRNSPLHVTATDLLSRFLGSLSFSGDIAAWDKDARHLVAQHVRLFKGLRTIEGSIRFLLPQASNIREWEAVHIAGESGTELLYVYRIEGEPEQSLSVDSEGWSLLTGSPGATLRKADDHITVQLPNSGAGLWARGRLDALERMEQ